MNDKALPNAPSLKGRMARGLLKVCGCLPIALLRGLGVIIGEISYWLNGRSAKVTRQNLALVYPDLSAQSVNTLARQSLRETAKTFMEMGAIWQGTQPWLRNQIVNVQGRELLDAKLAKGNGVLLIAPHFGNWEALGRYVSDCGQITNLYQPPTLVELDAYIRQARERSGAKVVPTDIRGVGALLKALKAGEIVGILPDQVPTKGAGEFAPFFGLPALTMTLCYQLQQRTKSDCLLGLAKRVAGGFEIIFAEPDAAIYSDDMASALTGLNKTVEACISYEPAQYQWEYKRYRRQPDNQPSPYQKR